MTRILWLLGVLSPLRAVDSWNATEIPGLKGGLHDD